ncbi:MAG: hypothetical protein ACI8P3_004217 [Saprospiraceae bacterium]|jgi:hypothetical protein
MKNIYAHIELIVSKNTYAFIKNIKYSTKYLTSKKRKDRLCHLFSFY